MTRPTRMLFDDVATTNVRSSTPVYWTVTCCKTEGGARVYVNPCTKNANGTKPYRCHWSLTALSLSPTEDGKRLWQEHPEVYTMLNTEAAREKIIGLLWRD